MNTFFNGIYFIVILLVCAYYLYYHPKIMAHLKKKLENKISYILVSILSLTLTLTIPLLGFILYPSYLNLFFSDLELQQVQYLDWRERAFYSLIAYVIGLLLAGGLYMRKEVPKK